MSREELQIVHLYNRAAFGFPLTGDPHGQPLMHLQQLLSSKRKSADLSVTQAGKVSRTDLMLMDKEGRRKLFVTKQSEMRDLNVAWLHRMALSDAPLNEKLTLFWHGHFACRNGVPLYMERYINIITTHAVGSFKSLLNGVAKSAAMLQFLNNQQNRKQQPNENFARELLELFTLGRGNYLEADVKAAARAFTGWGFDEEGAFVFREHLHDRGVKTFLGRTGNWDGEDILRFILEEKQCAFYICSRIWKFFVSDVADKQQIATLADSFYESGYNIEFLLNNIFSSDWFYSPAYMGNKIKSPVELLIPLIRDFRLKFPNTILPFTIQRIMGQVLLFPPNVGGWPGGRCWIDGSSLAYRMKLPRMLLQHNEDSISAKDDGDANGFSIMERRLHTGEKIQAEASWKELLDKYRDLKETEVRKELCLKLIAGNNFDEALATKYTSDSTKEEYIRSLTMHLMTLPEYQLC